MSARRVDCVLLGNVFELCVEVIGAESVIRDIQLFLSDQLPVETVDRAIEDEWFVQGILVLHTDLGRVVGVTWHSAYSALAREVIERFRARLIEEESDGQRLPRECGWIGIGKVRVVLDLWQTAQTGRPLHAPRKEDGLFRPCLDPLGPPLSRGNCRYQISPFNSYTPISHLAVPHRLRTVARNGEGESRHRCFFQTPAVRTNLRC